jgi:iron complex transport system permease protein
MTGQQATTVSVVRASSFHLRMTGLLILAALLVVLTGVSLTMGARALSLHDVWQALWTPDNSVNEIIVWHYRMPRALLAIVVGAGLGMAGALMQALTRNPLADPGLLGVHAGAAFAVVVAMSVFGVTQYRGYAVFALAGAGVAAVAVYLLAGTALRGASQVRLLLAGTALAACLSAATGIITLFDTHTFDAWRFWMVGGLSGRDIHILWSSLPLIAIGIILGLSQANALDSLALGDELGQALGQNVLRVRVICFIAIVLLCGAATAAVGPLGFVGLVVPHIVRLFVGPHWRWILPYGLLAGPVIVLAADILGRLIARPDEIEAGIVMALIGGPVLLFQIASVAGRKR